MALAALNKTALVFRNGADAFLKGLASNVPDAPKSAFLDPQGRIVATFDQARLGKDEILALVETQFVERLHFHLGKFLDLADCRMTEDHDRRAYFDFDGTFRPEPGDVLIPQKAGVIAVSARPVETSGFEPDVRLFRVRNAIPLQGADYDREMLLNLGDPGYVSYDKGCFLGQEIIARVHHRSRPPRKLVVRRESECAPEARSAMTSRVRDPESGETMGFLFVPND